MKKHLHATLAMARAGFAAGMLNVISYLTNRVRGVDTFDGWSALITLVFMVVLFALGGLLHSVIVSRVTRDAVPPTPGVQVMAGIAAGTAVGALLAAPMLMVAPLGEGVKIGAFLLGGGAFFGVLCGLLTPNHRRPASSPPAS